MKTRTQQIEELQKEWTQPRWEGITRLQCGRCGEITRFSQS